jgi:hypothetical protein
MATLKWRPRSQQNVFGKQSNDSSSELQANYCVGHPLAKETKRFSAWEKKLFLIPVNLSHATMTRQVDLSID